MADEHDPRWWQDAQSAAHSGEEKSQQTTPMGSGIPARSRLKPGQAVKEAERIVRRKSRRGIHFPNPFTLFMGRGRSKKRH